MSFNEPLLQSIHHHPHPEQTPRLTDQFSKRLSLLYDQFRKQSSVQSYHIDDTSERAIKNSFVKSVILSQWSDQDMPLIQGEYMQQMEDGERSQKILPSTIERQKYQNSQKNSPQKDLNMRIFSLSTRLQKFLYIFNLLMNCIFRAGMMVVVVFIFIQGKQYHLGATFLSLWFFAFVLYVTALTKIVFTKSSQMSVYFQKVFYRKPYADIQMDRVLRKHFTIERIFINLGKFLSPKTPFNKDLKISLLKQQLFKRMELMLVFVPFATMFALEIQWFEFPEFPNHDSDPYIAALIFLQFCRVCVNYLIIYVSS